MNKYFVYILAFWFYCLNAQSQQQTVGLLNYKPDLISEGYTLIYPRNQPTVFLLNNCGEIVHTWEDSEDYVPNNAVYLLENGDLLKCKKTPGTTFGTGGGGHFVELRSWENELLWSYELNTVEERLHHDAIMLPNGHIVMIAWEKRTEEEALEVGREIETLMNGVLYPDYIFEVDPTTNETVWEWHVWDHLIQDVDPTKINYGVIEEHPELIDINYVENQGVMDWDWLHINAIDYNEDLDQIMLCVPYFNELWVIDHSTSTEEAAGHVGGLYGKGGDLLYRIGNPQAYKKGNSDNQILSFPHDTHWTNQFITKEHTCHGKMLIFNNNNGNGFSKMEIFESSWDDQERMYLKEDGVFTPQVFEKSITHPMPSSFYSTGLSSVQLLPNNNILACSGKQGYIIELSPDGELVWEYKVPMKFGQAIPQGTVLQTNDNLTFRAFKYPPEYSAFEGRDLSHKDFIELEPQVDYCDRLVSSIELDIPNVNIYPNPVNEFLFIERNITTEFTMRLIDMQGKEIFNQVGSKKIEKINLKKIKQGNYMLILDKTQSFLITVLD